MDNASAAAGFGVIGLLLVVGFLVLWAILWVLLPFLVRGTNARLDKIIRQHDKSIERLDGILAQNELLLRYFANATASAGTEQIDVPPGSQEIALTSASPPGIADFASLLGGRKRDR